MSISCRGACATGKREGSRGCGGGAVYCGVLGCVYGRVIVCVSDRIPAYSRLKEITEKPDFEGILWRKGAHGLRRYRRQWTMLCGSQLYFFLPSSKVRSVSGVRGEGGRVQEWM